MEAKLAKLEEELNGAVAKKEALAQQASDCEKKLDRAGKLIGGLGGERTRWIANIASIEIDLVNTIGDVTIAGGHIAYTGPFTPPYRLALNNDWVNLLIELEVRTSTKSNIFYSSDFVNEVSIMTEIHQSRLLFFKRLKGATAIERKEIPGEWMLMDREQI